MRKLTTILLLLTISVANAQAFKGKGDLKGQMGIGLQNGGSGIYTSFDSGIGENMSYGFSANYILSNSTYFGSTPKFADRIDVRARFSANLGNVFKLDDKMDIYPGINIGTRNFGAHLGFRYFFTNGFGLFAEANAPISRFNNEADGLKLYNNQLVFNIGMSFNL